MTSCHLASLNKHLRVTGSAHSCVASAFKPVIKHQRSKSSDMKDQTMEHYNRRYEMLPSNYKERRSLVYRFHPYSAPPSPTNCHLCKVPPLHLQRPIISTSNQCYPLCRTICNCGCMQRPMFYPRIISHRKSPSPVLINTGPRDNLGVQLRNDDLWSGFHKLGNEMILTKAGRRMFPFLEFDITGLIPDRFYTFAIVFVLVDRHRYRYKNSSGWSRQGVVTSQPDCHVTAHPEGVRQGQYWINTGVDFRKLKLTNAKRPLTRQDEVCLESMHKYVCMMSISEFVNDHGELRHVRKWKFRFENTEFIAVTAYQNDEITQKKIDHNPFAKAFRELSHCNKSRSNSTEIEC